MVYCSFPCFHVRQNSSLDSNSAPVCITLWKKYAWHKLKSGESLPPRSWRWCLLHYLQTFCLSLLVYTQKSMTEFLPEPWGKQLSQVDCLCGVLLPLVWNILCAVLLRSTTFLSISLKWVSLMILWKVILSLSLFHLGTPIYMLFYFCWNMKFNVSAVKFYRFWADTECCVSIIIVSYGIISQPLKDTLLTCLLLSCLLLSWFSRWSWYFCSLCIFVSLKSHILK